MNAVPDDAASSAPLPPGAQHERTALAWQRTLMSAALGGILLTLTAIRTDATLIGGASGALVVYVAWRLGHRGPAHELRGGRRTAISDGLVRIVGVVVALALLGAAMALVHATSGTR
ncbi:DUF202 domain-containing protein [Sanguibacter antarcticus]|uniref:Uncharacterized protein DUF202 n=1 Tax=Sanguibacter antarcticus TaxID=372484 RepID=A0A2A9E6C2_9MICO|nr:DUF202 domain-containing protein [Sanguibacter antarcticus]PFG33720.1 uncharacterized protein DUF202 [Sanguibacter antarcticus]